MAAEEKGPYHLVKNEADQSWSVDGPTSGLIQCRWSDPAAAHDVANTLNAAHHAGVEMGKARGDGQLQERLDRALMRAREAESALLASEARARELRLTLERIAFHLEGGPCDSSHPERCQKNKSMATDARQALSHPSSGALERHDREIRAARKGRRT